MNTGMLLALPVWLDALVALLLVLGAGFALVGSWGLVKLSDFYRRLHGPSKATTLGVGAVLLASGAAFAWQGAAPSFKLWHELLVVLFLFMTAPVSAHLLVKAALKREAAAGAALPPKEPRG